MADPGPRHLDVYRQELRALGRDAFMRRYPNPVLVSQKSNPGDPDVGFFTDQIDGEELQRLVQAAKTMEGPPPGSPNDEGRVYFVAKRPGGPFQERIGVGRTRNTDVWLPYPSISKYHAYFTREADDRYYLTDVGSSNGTSIAGKALVAKTPTLLEDGAELAFGPHAFRFLGPDGFCDLLTDF